METASCLMAVISLLENGEIKKYMSLLMIFSSSETQVGGTQASIVHHLVIYSSRRIDSGTYKCMWVQSIYSILTWAWWPFRYDLFMVLGERWQWVFYGIDASVNDAIFWHRASNIPQPNPNDIGSMAEDETTLSVNPPPEGVKVSFILLIPQEIFN